MQITITDIDSATKRVTLKGRLDLAAVEAIGMPLATVTAARGNVVVDMAGVDFITSVGIRHLVLAAQKVTQGGGKLVLLWPSPNVADVLMVAGLEQILLIAKSEEEAAAALGRAVER
jgi:anti-anti-sigma factor